MKILIDTDILQDLSDPNSESDQLINKIIETSNLSLWVSALSIAKTHEAVLKNNSQNTGEEKLKKYQNSFSIIPLRNAILAEAFENENTDFDTQTQLASAEAFKMDCIITNNGDCYKTNNIPTFTPDVFLEKYNNGDFDNTTQVPFLDLKAQHHQIYNEIDDRITDIIANTGFILGKHVEEFEKRFAEIQEAGYCIGVSTGTDALHIALMALGIGPGDGVIVPVNTFIATAEAVSLCGATPVFVDCDDFYNIDVDKIEEILQETGEEKRKSGVRGQKTEEEKRKSDVRSQKSEDEKRNSEERKQKSEFRSQETGPDKQPLTDNYSRITGIIPVHLYGQPVNMDEIMALAEEYELMVVEDCCQAHLARWKDKSIGNFGAFGAFSFYPGKNLGAYGEAGALTTNDEELFLKAKMIRQHGEIERYDHKVIGHNYRMEAIQGAVLATKLKYLKEWTKKRKKNAQLYTTLLKDVDGVQTPMEFDGTDCVYHLYVIQTDDRDGLQQYLQQNGIATGLHYPIPLHLQKAYKHLGYKDGDFPVAEKAAKRILSLPMYPELTEKQILYVCNTIKQYFE